jgi:hypothetical protein
MKQHLPQDVLIQYQFDLLEEARHHEVTAHLEECGQCRQALEGVKRQFSALDVLDTEEALSDQLVQKTLASIHQSKEPGITGRRVWVKWGAIAAGIVLAAAIVFIGQDQWQEQSQQVLNTSQTLDDKGLINPAQNEHVSVKEDAVVAVKQPASISIVAQDQISDKPPFAPASAIELVVLPNPDKMQVTIYNSADLTLVRDTRRLTLKAGWNWLQFMWAGTQIDPTSLSLRPLEYADKVDVQQLVYPARLKDIGRWLIRSEVEGAVSFEITYFTSGLTWKAFYEGTISPDEKTMQLKSYVRVANNSGQDYQNTQTRLIVGKVHLLDEISHLAARRYPYGPEIRDDSNWDKSLVDFDEDLLRYSLRLGEISNSDGARMAGGGAGDLFFNYAIKDVAKEGLSEYFLYTIEGTEDLPNQWAKRLPSLDAWDIPIKSLYKYDEDRYSTQTIRFVSFANDTEHKLGTTPLPDGTIKLYRRLNAEQNLSYVGAASIKYIPVNEEVELNLGTDALVKAETLLTDSRTENYMFNDKGDITGWDEIETWQIKLTNTRDIPADFEITRNFKTDSWDIKVAENESIEYKKHDAQHARFTAVLGPQTETSFHYTVTRYCGIRTDIKMRQSQ